MVQRYRLIGGQPQPDPEGDFVRFADFRVEEDALEAVTHGVGYLFERVAKGEASIDEAVRAIRAMVIMVRAAGPAAD